MKGKGLSVLASCLMLIVIAVCSCTGAVDDKGKSYDESLLYGEWSCQAIGLNYRFNGDHSGKFFDKNGDGKSFTWNLSDDVLQIKVHGEGIHIDVFETYIITSLNTGTMTCYDEQDPSEILTFKIVTH